MLTFESPFYEEEGIIVFRDHADPALFHYLAGPPRLTRDDNGRPHLLLIKYRHALESLGDDATNLRERLGGGFLMFGVDCGIDDTALDQIKSNLQARVKPPDGAVSLVPVLYSRGSVSVLALDRQSSAGIADDPDAPDAERTKFVRQVLGTATPSLLQDQRAIFSLALTPDGVTLLEEAYRSELSPIGVMYELEFAGLRPALAVTAKVDLTRMSEKLSLEFGVKAGGGGGGGGGGTAATAASETEGGSDSGSGSSESGGESDTSSTVSGGAGTGAAFQAKLGFVLETLRSEGAIDIDIVRQQAGEEVAAMERQAMDLLKESVLNDFFRPVMTTQPSAAQTTEAARQLLQATSRQTNQGSAGGSNQVEIGFELKYERRDEQKTTTYDYRVQAPETRTHAPNGFFSALVDATEQAEHIREVDLDDEFFKLLKVNVTTTADFESLELDALAVELQYGGTIEAPNVTDTFVFTPSAGSAKEFRAFIENRDPTYRYRLDYKFGEAGDVAAVDHDRAIDWRTATTRALIVHPPDDLDILRLLIEPGRVDWEVVERIETRIVYEHEEFRAERSFLFASGSEPQRWTVRLPEGAPRRYKATHVWHLVGGNQIVGEQQELTDARVFVNDPFADRLPIIIDPQVDPNDVLRVVVELLYEDPANNLEIRRHVELVAPEYRATTVDVPVIDPRRREFSFRVRLIKKGGLTEDRPAQQSDSLSVVITPGGFLLDVQVALLGQLEALQLTAVQVDLRADPLDGAVQQTHSLLFMPGDALRTTQRLLMRADRTAEFEYRVQAFLADGRSVGAEWQRHSSQILPVPLAALISQ